MKKIIQKIAYTLAAVFLCVLTLFNGGILTATAAETDGNNFDETNVLDDLRSSDGFNILKYPFYDLGKKEMYVINVAEYCYSFKANMRANYGLYLYVYNPNGQNIDTASKANTVQMAVAYDSYPITNESKPTAYEKFDLQFCNKAEETNYKNLFYKFKVIDHESADGKTILERVNSGARRYDISGFELLTYGSTNAIDYTVGGSYIFTGYAAGYGSDTNSTESTLACDVRELETIRLDLTGEDDGLDKRTYWRSNSSSLGANHQNQINSVFFAIDKDVLERYGYTLQKIKAEWWEYKTRPAVVIDNKTIYDNLAKYSGMKISEDYDRNRGYTLDYVDYQLSGGSTVVNYGWSWNAELGLLGIGLANYSSSDIETLLPLLFYTDGIDINEYTLSPDTLKTYFQSYNKSYEKGHLTFSGHDYSADLFADNVDNGRTRGYNLREFDIANPDDYWDIRSYDSSHNWWDKLWDYGFGSITTNDDYPDVAPIQMIKPEDLTVSDVANHLKINPEDVGKFKDYYNSVKKDSEVFIFRYAQTDYFATDLNVFSISEGKYGTHYNDVAELRQGTQFFDFDILEFTFNKEGVYTVIPVVSSPLDHWSGYSPSKDPDKPDWWKIVIGVVLLIFLLVVLQVTGILPLIVHIVGWVILLPFRLIGALFKGIGNLFHKKD